MGTRKIRGLMVIGLTIILMVGCASTEPEDTGPDIEPSPEPPKVVTPPPAPPIREVIKPNVKGGILYFPENEKPVALQGMFYFDFDQAIVKRSGHMELNKHANFLADNRSARVRIEGHADERGTREYNLALGERRANAIRTYLMAQGAASSQMEVISYGEEKPAAAGHNESAWSRNRRVELKYR